MMQDYLRILKMYPEDFINDSLQHADEQWLISDTTTTSIRLECDIELQWCSNNADDWYNNQYQDMIGTEIAHTLMNNDAAMSIIHIVQAVQHKFWKQPQVLMQTGVPVTPDFGMIFQQILHLPEVECTSDEQGMPVWRFVPL